MAVEHGNTLSRRRALWGVAALPALTLGGPTDTDAELVRLAREVLSIEARLNTRGLISDEDAEAESRRMSALEQRMATIPAQGLEGIAAKARRIHAELADDCPPPLVTSLITDLVRMMPTVAV